MGVHGENFYSGCSQAVGSQLVLGIGKLVNLGNFSISREVVVVLWIYSNFFSMQAQTW